MTDALLIVDFQRDFTRPDGSLFVQGAPKLLPNVNRYVEVFHRARLPILATRDWHPRATEHFDTWPAHCVQGTPGAELDPDLILPPVWSLLFSKGTDPGDHGYSGAAARLHNGIDLMTWLANNGAHRVFLCGVATDYCVRATALDLAKEFAVTLLLDAVAGVGLAPGDIGMALYDIYQAGAEVCTLDDIDDALSGAEVAYDAG